MYHKHTTEGIVLQSLDNGEYNKLLSIFTSEFGLIYARAQNVRHENSKLRFGVQDFTYGSFSLVKGRNGWRLVGAEGQRDFYTTLRSVAKRKAVANIFSLLKKLLDEEKNQILYEIVLNFLHDLEYVAEEKMNGLESLTVLHILDNMGVLPEVDFKSLEGNTDLAIKLINQSLKSM